MSEMMVTTSETVAGMTVKETLGLVRGNTIRARHIGRDIKAVFRHMIGGELADYTKMLGESREQAIDRMMAEAEELGANGIICVRFTTSQIMGGAAELMAYGTAVVLE